ncbi:MAG: formylglycine-generating enzyme family protein [Verrucomicrobiales bacterium]|nr:formylglycine-generating enzyme family protein [Verrucomicrobiales bacterium]
MKSGLNTDPEFEPRSNRRWPFNVLVSVLLVVSNVGGLGCGKSGNAPESAASTTNSQTAGSSPAAATASNPGEPSTVPAEAKVPAASGEMVLVARGTFVMGDKDEVDAPPHEVTVGPFLMDKNLVTQEQYEKAMGDNPSRWKGEKNPVEQVRWSDAVRYCNKRSELEGLEPCYDLQTWKCRFEASGYRLPTEAEWEYACRAGTTTRYFFGDNASKLGNYAWFDKNAGGRPRPAGQKQPNPWGLYDMSGNVWQWCNDFYQVDYYSSSPKEDPRGPEAGDKKVVRGGAWRFGAETCKSGYRYNESPGYADVCFGYDIYGFRCVRKAK